MQLTTLVWAEVTVTEHNRAVRTFTDVNAVMQHGVISLSARRDKHSGFFDIVGSYVVRTFVELTPFGFVIEADGVDGPIGQPKAYPVVIRGTF